MTLIRLTLNINNMKNYGGHGHDNEGNNNLSLAMKEAYDFFYKTY